MSRRRSIRSATKEVFMKVLLQCQETRPVNQQNGGDGVLGKLLGKIIEWLAGFRLEGGLV